MRLADVVKTPIVGNAHSDHDLLNDLHLIAVDESLPISERAGALRHMDAVMGEESPVETDEEAITNYLRDCA